MDHTAEGTTMTAKPSTTEKNGVTLIRQGVGREEYPLPEGATLAELLHSAQTQIEGHTIYIDGKPLEEQFTLQPGMIVTLVPRPTTAPAPGSWREGIGMFNDDPTFREMVEAVEKSREAEKDCS